MRYVALFLLPAFFISSTARADSQRDCAVHADNAARIAACSELIKKNPRDAAALLSRASAFQSKGEMDRALADFSKAVELKPNYAAAYERRGAAYAAKGDYVRAVADVTRAEELSQAARLASASAKVTPASTKVVPTVPTPQQKLSTKTPARIGTENTFAEPHSPPGLGMSVQ
jgi:tetratricopeptide (TPR) repeat protein